jgi:hypothetical protein
MRRLLMLAIVGLGVGFGVGAYSGTWRIEAERSGCCSHHNGVCGCEKGRAVCCDGQFSPTCGCD